MYIVIYPVNPFAWQQLNDSNGIHNIPCNAIYYLDIYISLDIIIFIKLYRINRIHSISFNRN